MGEQPYDVGVDHAWMDEQGFVWVTTFRKHNPGLHLMSYDAGELLYSLHGFANVLPDQFTYPAGLSGVGKLGKPGSYVAVTASTMDQYDIPLCGGPLKCGEGVLFIVDIGNIKYANGTKIVVP